MKIVETWRLFFQFYFLQVRVQEVQLGEATQHEEKDTVITCIDVDCQYVRACSYQKEDNKAGAKEKSSNKQVLNLTETAEIPTMDTTLSTDATSSNIMNNTMEGLYRLGKDDKLVPGVAKSYEKSEDGKKYVFKLREDAKWSNGEPVTAKDFVYSWRRAVDSNTGAKFAYILFDVKMRRKLTKRITS